MTLMWNITAVNCSFYQTLANTHTHTESCPPETQVSSCHLKYMVQGNFPCNYPSKATYSRWSELQWIQTVCNRGSSKCDQGPFGLAVQRKRSGLAEGTRERGACANHFSQSKTLCIMKVNQLDTVRPHLLDDQRSIIVSISETQRLDHMTLLRDRISSSQKSL